jgi:hypothetical protein
MPRESREQLQRVKPELIGKLKLAPSLEPFVNSDPELELSKYLNNGFKTVEPE